MFEQIYWLDKYVSLYNIIYRSFHSKHTTKKLHDRRHIYMHTYMFQGERERGRERERDRKKKSQTHTDKDKELIIT